MDGAIGLEKRTFAPLRIRALLGKLWQWTGSLLSRLLSACGKIKTSHPSARRAREIAPLVAIVVGAIGFGWWLSSFAAALVTGVALFFLAGIYKGTGQIVSALLRWECDRMAGTRSDVRAFGLTEQNNRNIETVAAIQNLQSWVTNETSPTEETMKASCAILLQSLVR